MTMRLLVGLILSAGATVLTGAEGEPGEDPLIELPELTVVDRLEFSPPESWRYAQIDGMEVLTNGSAAQSNQILKQFRIFRQALAVVRPSPEPAGTLSIILCGAEHRFSDFRPEGQPDEEGIVSRLLHDREHTAIVIDLETRSLFHSDISMRKPNGQRFEEMRVDHERLLFREYSRHLLGSVEFPPPAWFIEGMAQVATDLECDARSIRYGFIGDSRGAPIDVGIAEEAGRTVEAGTMIEAMTAGSGEEIPTGDVGDRPFSAVLRGQELLPMERFLAVRYEDPEARNPLGNARWCKQAYAFVHLCLFRTDGKLKEPLGQFVRRLANEPPSEQLFQECFGLTYRQMRSALSAHINRGRYAYRNIRLAEGSELEAEDVPFREATQGEIARIKADALRLAGRREEALLTLRAGFARGAREPGLLAALGVEWLRAGDINRARQLLEAAAKGGMVRPSAWAALARLRLEETRAAPGEHGRLSAAQTAAVLIPLLKARTIAPAIPETYQLMAEAWELSAVTPTPANIHMVGEGVAAFPFDTQLSLRTAELYARAGDTDDALKVARTALRFSPGVLRPALEALISTLEPPSRDSPAPDSPASGASRASFENLIATIPPPPDGASAPPAD